MPKMSDFYPTITDVSHHQGVIDWATAKPYLHFTILRAQDGTMGDRQIVRNVRECERLSIPYYIYGYYRGGGAAEAARMIGRSAHDKCLGFCCDLEESGYDHGNIRRFAQECKGQGGKTGLYLAHHLYEEYKDVIDEFEWLWIPRYGANTGKPVQMPSYACDLWQFTSVGSVPGIPGNVDLNACVNKDLSFFVPSYAPPRKTVGGFSDVYEDDWFAECVVKAKDSGWMKGYGDGFTFGPNDPLTRAQAVVTLARVAGADLSSPYGDVSASPYYYEAVEWAKDSGVASGEIKDFRPDDAATRAEFSTFLWRLKGEPDADALADYEGAAEWAEPALAWAVSTGVMGNTGGIRPNDACTRAECATMLCNLHKDK